MAVRRIVANISAGGAAGDAVGGCGGAAAFYCGVLGLDVAMDLGWIVTFAGAGVAAPQVSVAMEGGSGTAVPDLSVEVDDLDAVHRRALEGGFAVEYGPVREPWGVRRFFVRDPFGRVVNVLMHDGDG